MEETILIVDDETHIRATLRGILSDEGYRVLDADDALQALSVIAVYRPDLVILDIWMPHMDGIELLDTLKTREPELPIIVVSGHGTIETAVRATKLGAADFIEKPFSLETLLRSVRRAMRKEANDDQDAAPPPPLSLTHARTATHGRIRARTISQSVVEPRAGTPFRRTDGHHFTTASSRQWYSF